MQVKQLFALGTLVIAAGAALARRPTRGAGVRQSVLAAMPRARWLLTARATRVPASRTEVDTDAPA